MDQIRQLLAPLTDWMPAGLRNQLSIEVWWIVFLVAALIVVLMLLGVMRRMVKAVFGSGRRTTPTVQDRVENLNTLPLPKNAPGPLQLYVYHLPVRLRLLIVAPVGKDMDLDATAIEKILDRLLPGLKAIIERDRPCIRVWQAQLSHQGFVNTFHRSTPLPEGEGQPSCWVLAAGRALLGRQPLLLGMGLWTAEPQNFGRITLEPHQWLDVLRLREQ